MLSPVAPAAWHHAVHHPRVAGRCANALLRPASCVGHRRPGGDAWCTRGPVAAVSAAVQLAVPQRRGFALHLPRRNSYREVPEGIKPVTVAIVGRPNVGKSTLFNRLLAGTRKKKTPVPHRAIVSDMPGTTRDRKEAVAVFGSLVMRIVDTGGLESFDAMTRSTLLASMREQAVKAIAQAEAVLFVFDAREGVTPLDLQVARMLHEDIKESNMFRNRLGFGEERASLPVILVANKAEGSFVGAYLNDCYDFGFGDPVVISAEKSEGMEELHERLSMEIGHLQIKGGKAGDEFDDEEDDVMSGSEAEDSDASAAAGEGAAPAPTLKWMPSTPLTEKQKLALQWYAKHPSNPFGEEHAALKETVEKSVEHRDANDSVPRYWLSAPQRALPDKESRDYVMKFRRLQDQDRPMRLSVIGLPSTGKSSIVNALLQEERVIVDNVDGTTMDSVVCDWKFKDQDVKLIDTCGIYAGWNYPGSSTDFLEPGMGTKKAIRRSHVCVLVLDVHRYRKMTYYACPSKFELTLANFIIEEGKNLIIAVNKWDMVDEAEQPKVRDEILKTIKDCLPDCKGVPVVFMSAKYNLNLSMLMIRSAALYKRWGARLPTSKLNAWLQAWMIRWPPPWRHGSKSTVKYITQTRSRPPTFVLWTNTTWYEFPQNYIRQIQNHMREEFRIQGVPIKFILRSTLMPKPGKKVEKKSMLKWKRMGPKQADAVMNLTSKRMLRKASISATNRAMDGGGRNRSSREMD